VTKTIAASSINVMGSTCRYGRFYLLLETKNNYYPKVLYILFQIRIFANSLRDRVYKNNDTHIVMSRICDLTGKTAMNGFNVSNSNVKTKRKFYPNLKVKKFYIPDEDRWITLKVSTSAIKTINKNGISAVISKFLKKGFI